MIGLRGLTCKARGQVVCSFIGRVTGCMWVVGAGFTRGTRGMMRGTGTHLLEVAEDMLGATTFVTVRLRSASVTPRAATFRARPTPDLAQGAATRLLGAPTAYILVVVWGFPFFLGLCGLR